MGVTVLTVEKAAAAKIFLETYYNELLTKPSPRSLRLQYLEVELYHDRRLSLLDRDLRRRMFYQQESDYLRETRVLKARSNRSMIHGAGQPLVDSFETLKILGKGSFGVVKLVRERTTELCYSTDGEMPASPVYAMKVIRKSAMLKTSQEGHLRAERDVLVASAHARWIVPLVASFQDTSNLYLVMEYMPGGDFLSLLIRENILSEPVTKFYIAQMILCIEEAHSLRCIHRDIKPDNFLVSASGHLKISDFGLAFDGHWSHDTSYYHTHRYSLVHKLNLAIAGDAEDRSEGLQGGLRWHADVARSMRKHQRPSSRQATESSSAAPASATGGEPLLSWRNRCTNRSSARSIVGTSQYMAPEVVRGAKYDARCDWWSLGIILYECLYGFTPFVSEDGDRAATKRNIVNHLQTFDFPARGPPVSRHGVDLLLRLLRDKETRLSSKRYQVKDAALLRAAAAARGGHPSSSSFASFPSTLRNFASSRHNNGAHHHQQQHLDWAGRAVFPHDAEDIKAHKWFREIPWDHLHLVTPPFVPALAGVEDTRYFDVDESASDWSESQSDDDNDEVDNDDDDDTIMRSRTWTSTTMMTTDGTLDSGGPRLAPNPLAPQQQRPVRQDKRRPRDRLLRDRNTKAVVLRVRKQTAFKGYTWRRNRAWHGGQGVVMTGF